MAKKKTPPPPELILEYHEYRFGGDIHDPDDPYSTRDSTSIDWYPTKIYIDEPGIKAREKTKTWNVECLLNKDVQLSDTLYLVVVRYSDGDSYGSTSGNWHIHAVLKEKLVAYDLKRLIEKDNETYRAFEYTYPRPKGKYVALYNEHKCWQGYFSRLESVEVMTFTVE